MSRIRVERRSNTRRKGDRSFAEHWEKLRAALTETQAELVVAQDRLARIDAYANQRCEGEYGDAERHAPVEYLDSQGVPLCPACWEALEPETEK